MRKTLLFAMSAVLSLAVVSCQKDNPTGDVPEVREDADEIVLAVEEDASAPDTKSAAESGVLVQETQDSLFFVEREPLASSSVLDGVQTKAGQVTSISSFYLSVFSSGSMTRNNQVFTKGADNYFRGGLVWPASDPHYHFYASNVSLGTDGKTVTTATASSAGVDDIVCASKDAVYKTTNNLVFDHVMARIGAFSITAPPGLIVSNASASIAAVPTVGTYDLSAGTWSASSANRTVSLSATNDIYVVPGSYTISVSYTLSGPTGESQNLTKSGTVAIVKGNVNNIRLNLAGTTTKEIVVSPSSASVNVGGQTQFTATCITKVNGILVSSQDVTSSATWSTSRNNIATVSGGNVTGVGAGTATISAAYSGVTGSATVTVSNVVTYELDIYAENDNINVGGTTYVYAKYYTVTNGVRGSYSVVADLTEFSYSPSGVLQTQSTYSSFIVVKGLSAGTATVTGTYNGHTAQCTINVNSVVSHRLTVSPSSATIYVGGTRALTAKYYTVTDGVSDAGVDVTSSASWSSSSTGVASVASGIVTGVSAGSSTVTATYSGASGTSAITVQNDYVTYARPTFATAPSWNDITAAGAAGALSNVPSVTVALTYASGRTENVTVNYGDGSSYGTWSFTGTAGSNPNGFSVNGTTGAATANSLGDNSAVRTLRGYAYATFTMSADYGGRSTTSRSSSIYQEANTATYGNVQITSFSYPLKDATQGSVNPTLTYSQSATWSSGATSTVTSGATLSFATVTDHSAATLNTTNGQVTWQANSGAQRSEVERVTVTLNGKTATAQATSQQEGADVEYRIIVTQVNNLPLYVGDTKSFRAIYYTITNGVQDAGVDVTDLCTWTSSNTSVATITSTGSTGRGVATGVSVGSTTLTASYAGCSGIFSLSVYDANWGIIVE